MGKWKRELKGGPEAKEAKEAKEGIAKKASSLRF